MTRVPLNSGSSSKNDSRLEESGGNCVATLNHLEKCLRILPLEESFKQVISFF